MADVIRHKRSATAAAVPSAGQLELGELAINVADGRLFFKKANGAVVDVTSIAGIIGLTEALAGKVNAGDMDFTIIYPNGGSSSSPANVSINTRYVESNPFPGFSVICQAELRIGGRWYVPGWYSDNSGGSRAYGVRANFDGTELIVQTGVTAVAANGRFSGGTYNGSDVTTATPCRVKVWKVKGAF